MHHTVAQGECVVELASRFGLHPDTIWQHAANQALRARREKQILFPGDVVFVPELRAQSIDCATEKRHVFRRRGVPTMLRIRVLNKGASFGSARYVLTVDEHLFEGKPGPDGVIEAKIPPGSRAAKLKLITAEQEYEFDVELGSLDPIGEVTGVQQRLRSLGYYAGDADGQAGPQTRAALASFQRDRGLPVTEAADAATKRALEQAYGS
jgi:N-acetylmuramoyl-L-alanine amidase